MPDRFSRTAMLLGDTALSRLAAARVAVFGAGGVGGAVIEALARCGVGTIDVVDNDTIDITNLNRQLLATASSIGVYKTDAAKARILSINSNAAVYTHRLFYLPETAHLLALADFDYIVDAMDTVTAKIHLITEAQRLHIPVVSSMGTGNKLHPELLELADLSKTSVCPLAKVMRRELKKRGVRHLKVVYSKEPPQTPAQDKPATPAGKRQAPGSVSFVPPVAGYILAGEVVRDLINTKE